MSKAVKPGSIITNQGDNIIEDEKDIPIEINLPGFAMTFTTDWILGTISKVASLFILILCFLKLDHQRTYVDTSLQDAAKVKQNELLDRIRVLETENQYLREKCEKVHDESNMDKFKSQLLVEMVICFFYHETKNL